MFKKTILTIAMFTGLAGVANAADPVSVEFDVRADVPTVQFYVSKDGGWEDVVLNYNAESEAFTPNNSRYLRARNTTGAINAYLDHAPVLMHSDTTTKVDLSVAVNEKPLKVGPANAVEILSATDAGVTGGAKIPMLISSNNTSVKAGSYSGKVLMMFDAVTPTP
ncbi:CS1 type fimbrial major subunit [Amphritea sp.]|uniref:CS1 type fimbrial major subunit n=1 Tax=Amphritea sp. TaxID=1872502 RepID=UPI003A8F116B